MESAEKKEIYLWKRQFYWVRRCDRDPMHQDGTVNFEELGRVLEFQIENGTDAIIICGTTGESATLNHESTVK